MAYAALPVLPKIGTIRVCRPEQGQPGVSLDSSALLVMTDLKRVAAAVISPQETMDRAHAFMMQRGVRMLLALDDRQTLAGIVTTNDILGEKPVAVVEERRMRHDEILVADVMTPADRLEAFDMHTVQSAQVGQVVAALQRARRHHAIVVQTAADGTREVRGIFSLSQIARQLGIPLQLPTEAKSFAELEAALY
ncbi:CBS domain-containing protein [Ramlibacter alkalitolerans]|uniref:CBS domain-containing protein n=1 Tax=Ramlibacter alkalitolerans TaxID=2039631 RepID=A0ABS1JQN2_9BURK|nr:CBS domain-containing protein [Ramlibacter alkalitolerans]MBL0426513.1 CBS domain-containing protein [Ramlibacter alkalitolerans]